ncbi:M42 family metallopeptidase [Erysipelothrix sp. HDW6C]|uniref:M42 family metallopeptidase n=1 Tax=Erysipelothrix sp. HDW6C TaxID=2714930 RepID=UPI00140D403B|nr:M42 family metallopeptidase [Erysipelothrix sp. HDW6C]QIK70524.1 M42 family metallopeptidase [Erysipelothrix sp. HDW6C]
MDKKVEKLEEAYGDVNLSMLADFALTNGISGHEREMAQVYKNWVEEFSDDVSFDNLGSIIAHKEGAANGPKIMFAGHIDEIGFLVKSIDDNGFLRLHPVGGWWPHVLLSQPVTITTRSGQDYVGVVGSKAPHGMAPAVRNKVMELKDLYVDLGVASKDEVRILGIQVGDAITPKADFHVMANPNYLMSKAWDNRIGAAVAAEVIRGLKNESTDAHIYSVGTVQEEVGLRGAKTAAQKINPDIAVTIDTTIATDTPGETNNVKLGVGVTLEVMDASYISHKGLLYHLQDLCDELGIDYQFELLSAGGTDSGEIHKVHDGVITVTVSIPTRYIHSHYGIIHRKDYLDTVKLLTEFARRANAEVLEELRNYKR